MITGVTTTFNSEATIALTLKSFSEICSEIIVVDSGSTDTTLEIVKSYATKVIHQDYLGNGPQNNTGINNATNDWIILLDSDEFLDRTAINAINHIKLKHLNNESCFEIERKNYIGDKFIPQCGWSPDPQVRLFNKNFFQFKNVIAHSKVVPLNNRSMLVEKINGHIEHKSFINYHHLFHKANTFSTRSANDFLLRKNKISTATPIVHMIAAFIKSYIFKRGFIAGIDGLAISISQAVYTFLKYAKALEDRSQIDKNIWGE